MPGIGREESEDVPWSGSEASSRETEAEAESNCPCVSAGIVGWDLCEHGCYWDHERGGLVGLARHFRSTRRSFPPPPRPLLLQGLLHRLQNHLQRPQVGAERKVLKSQSQRA